MDDGVMSPTRGRDSHGLARPVQVDARSAVGGDEPTNFTPWLARNIDVLGTALGLDLRVLDDPADALVNGVHIEVVVGGYFLDILATDAAGRTVAIENQYGMGDHRHLGQLLTYASGVGADVLVWVAESFSDAHLETLRWLNERTDDKCGFFAVRARFLRIAESPPAPVFELVAGPSEWARIRRDVVMSADAWTIEAFMASTEDDHELVADLFAWVQQVPTSGERAPLWFGHRPHGSVYLHPGGCRFAPAMVWVNARGLAMFTGAWNNYGERVAKHPAFRHVAEVLGQDHTGSARGLPLRDLPQAQLRDAMLTTAAELEELRSGEASEPLGGHMGSDELNPNVP